MLHKILSTCVLAMPLIAGATEYQIVERPRQKCWNEQVPVQKSGGQGVGGAIIGGIAGGILGNQVGKGSGNTVATAAGAATGAVIGDRMAGQSSSQGTSYQTVQKCETVMERVRVPVEYEQRSSYSSGSGSRFCPPGQAKKGNC